MSGPLLNFAGLGNEMFIETGTFRGDTVRLAIDSKAFSLVRSIEIDRRLYHDAILRFRAHAGVQLYYGASADILPLVIDRIRPTTFWLDAHKTIVGGQVEGEFVLGTECPLLIELDLILSEPWEVPLIVVIDDARMFGDEWWAGGEYSERFSRGEWPTTVQIVDRLIAAGLRVSHEDDRIIARNNKGA